MTPSAPSLRKTPLNDWHRARGAKLVPLAGWELPAEYAGAAEEHQAVRRAAGMIDLSHLRELEVAGKDAAAALHRMTAADASAIEVGQVRRAVLAVDGKTIDHLLVCRLGKEHFLIVANGDTASPVTKVVLQQAASFADAVVLDTSSRYALLALQGPSATDVLQDLTGADLSLLPDDGFTYGEVASARTTIARADFTGSGGYALLVPPAMAVHVADAALRIGGEFGLVPVGFEALRTLRAEAGLPQLQ